LAASIEYFRGLFNSGMADAVEKRIVLKVFLKLFSLLSADITAMFLIRFFCLLIPLLMILYDFLWASPQSKPYS